MKLAAYGIVAVTCLMIGSSHDDARGQTGAAPDTPLHDRNAGAAVAAVANRPDANIVDAGFFGMHIAAQLDDGWPTVPFGIQRTWDSWPSVSWSALNPAREAYHWAVLDALVDDSLRHGVDLVYTFGYVPSWASTNAAGKCGAAPAGSCYAPTIRAWKDFVSRIVARYKGKIRYWELWNEPDADNFWRGSNAQMVAMAREAHAVVEAAGGTLLSPSPQGMRAWQWLDNYFSAGGAAYTDVISFHGYLHGAPEMLPTLIANIRRVQARHGLAALALWDTEHSWGAADWPMGADENQQAAWLARYLLLSFSQGIQRSIWYGWEHFSWGTLYDRRTRKILKPGIAYRELHKWMTGAALTDCQPRRNTLYRCRLLRPNSYRAEILWSSGDPVRYKIPAGYACLKALDGRAVPVAGGQWLRIEMTPVLLEYPAADERTPTAYSADKTANGQANKRIPTDGRPLRCFRNAPGNGVAQPSPPAPSMAASVARR